MVLVNVLEGYFYFRLFVYVAMVNRTYSIKSFKNTNRCVLIQTPYNKKIPSLYVFFSGVCVGSWMAWFGTKVSFLCNSSNRKKIFTKAETNHLESLEILLGLFTCTAWLWAINMFIYKIKLFNFFLKIFYLHFTLHIT